jgi:CheY-like chemotaxis protein
MDGYEVARRLRATPNGPDMLIVAVSGYRKVEGERSEQSDFDAHLLKPVDFDALNSLLKRGKVSQD